MIRLCPARALAVAVALGACLPWPFRHGRKPVAAPPTLANAPRTIDSLWRVGQRAFNRGKWGDATKVFDRLGTVMPASDPRTSRLHFFQGEIQFAQGNELMAVRDFRRIADETPEDSLAPDALLRAADAYTSLWKRPELDPTYGQTALSVYQEVTTRYPGTSAARRAEGRRRELEERFAYKEYRNALFYYRFHAYDSAILSLRSLVAQYPKTAVVPDALEHLVLSYRALGYQEDIKDTCAYITKYFPAPAGPRRLCPRDSTGAQ